MGFLVTRWEASYEGRQISVTRHELGRSFNLERTIDGKELRSAFKSILQAKLSGSRVASINSFNDGPTERRSSRQTQANPGVTRASLTFSVYPSWSSASAAAPSTDQRRGAAAT